MLTRRVYKGAIGGVEGLSDSIDTSLFMKKALLKYGTV
jgi:hypothetical protein